MGTAEFTPKQVRHLFFEREKQQCFYCGRQLSFILRGSPIAGGWSIHHRKGRGMGMNTYPNALVLCGNGVVGCHGDVTANPAWGYEVGLAILRNATTPEYEPENVHAMDRAGRWFSLTRDGRAVEVERGTRR